MWNDKEVGPSEASGTASELRIKVAIIRWSAQHRTPNFS